MYGTDRGGSDCHKGRLTKKKNVDPNVSCLVKFEFHKRFYDVYCVLGMRSER